MALTTWTAYFFASILIALSPGSGAVLAMSHGLSYGVRRTQGHHFRAAGRPAGDLAGGGRWRRVAAGGVRAGFQHCQNAGRVLPDLHRLDAVAFHPGACWRRYGVIASR